MNNTFNKDLVVLRAFAIILVVFGHSIIIFDPEWTMFEPSQPSELLYTVKRFINVVQMPLFISLSGYLFYSSISKRDSTYFEFVKKKYLRIIIPYIIITFLWMNPIKWIVKFQDINSWEQLLFGQILGKGETNGHLWFLYCLFVIFLISKFIILIEYKWYVDFILLGILSLIHLASGKLTGLFSISTVSYYFVYFFVGYMINKYLSHFEKKHNKFFIPCIICIWTFCVYFSHPISNLILVILILIGIYMISFNRIHKSKFVNDISTFSFGIYLFHSPLIYITYTYFADIHPILIIIINFLFWGSISYLITMLLKNSKLKFIIGD